MYILVHGWREPRLLQLLSLGSCFRAAWIRAACSC